MGVLPGHSGKVTFSLFIFWSVLFWPSYLEKKNSSFETIMKRMAPFSFLRQPHKAFDYGDGAMGISGEVQGKGGHTRYSVDRKPQPLRDSVLLVSVASVYLLFKLPQKKSCSFFPPPALNPNSTFLSYLAPQPRTMKTPL